MKSNPPPYALLLAALGLSAPARADETAERNTLERGRYLTVSGGGG